MINKDFHPLVAAPIWREQKMYYANSGESAWNYVPFLYTSNKFMANWVADMIFNLSRLHPGQKIQVIELGSGHGMFGYFLYQRLKSLQVDFVLTISDFIVSNLDYLKSLPQWQGLDVNWLPLDDVNELKNAYEFDGVNFVIANYFFDSLPNDGFEFVDGQWQRVYLATDKKKNKVDGFVDIKLSFESRPCDLTDQELAMLKPYEGVTDHVLVPLAVKQLLAQFYQSNQASYFFVNDKGFVEKNKINYADDYAYRCDGAMATMVNFDMIKQWVTSDMNGFFVVNENDHDDSHFVVFGINTELNQQKQMVEMALSGPSWNMVFKLFMVYENQPEMSFEDACFYVQCSEYDEAMMSRISGFFMNQIKLHGELIHELRPILLRVIETFYWHPARLMYFYAVLDLLVLCGELETSKDLIEKYRHLVPSQYDVLIREGVILYKQRAPAQAKEVFEKALKINPKCTESKKYLELI